jgi:hypothetical protein
MTANQYSASVPRHQGSPDRSGGTADRSDSSTGGRHRPLDDDDSPYFPPLMIALILAVFMIWIGTRPKLPGPRRWSRPSSR